MDKLMETAKRQWQDVANVLLGIWLIASPWIIGFTEVQYTLWNAYILGAIIAVAAASALVAFHEWEEWVSMLFGAWLIVSPWGLEFATLSYAAETLAAFGATWNFIVVGFLVVGLAGWRTWQEHQHGQAAT